ncbi:MarR family transcriptional regulator [Vibrio sp. NH-UV-68]|uniref:MarR family winged helix-turn-helix transcriptional regulator n=1 Tax=unclassified Vibrio TaxID=2614977 RepID=UPI0036F1B80B
MSSDSVDSILAQWKSVRPDLDCSSMGVVGRLRRTSNAWKSKMDKVFKEHGLSSIEFDILATMRRSDPSGITPTELYKTLMLSSGAVSTRLEQLVKKGVVERVSSECDRRSCKVILTSKGVELVDTTLNAHIDNMDNMLNVLTKKEQQQLASLLCKVLAYKESDTR